MLSASDLYAFLRAARYLGTASAIRIPRIASTTTSSISVKPRSRLATVLFVHANMFTFPPTSMNTPDSAPADQPKNQAAELHARPLAPQRLGQPYNVVPPPD